MRGNLAIPVQDNILQGFRPELRFMQLFMDPEGVVGLVEHNRPQVLVHLDCLEVQGAMVPLELLDNLEVLHLLDNLDLQVKMDLVEAPDLELDLELLDK